MTSIGFSIDLQNAQLGAQFLGIAPILAGEMSVAMIAIESLLANDTVMRMDWQNPSGALEDSIFEDSSSTTWTATIGSHLPYTRRRDWGFDDYDSLGRRYHDIGAYFLEDTLDDNIDNIQARIQQAVQNTFSAQNILAGIITSI